MSATIKLTLIDYRVREYLDDWRSNLMLTQYVYPDGETQQFMNMLDELDGVHTILRHSMKTCSRLMITPICLDL